MPAPLEHRRQERQVGRGQLCFLGGPAGPGSDLPPAAVLVAQNLAARRHVEHPESARHLIERTLPTQKRHGTKLLRPSAGPGGTHAADAGVGARIDREEQARVLDLTVQLLAGDAGLDGDCEVLRIDAHHTVHARQVDADATLHGQQMAFERGADAERDHRHRVPVGLRDHEGHLVGALAEDDRFRRRGCIDRLIAAMLVAYRGGGGEAFAEALRQGRFHRGGHRTRDHAGQQFVGCVHGGLLPGRALIVRSASIGA